MINWLQIALGAVPAFVLSYVLHSAHVYYIKSQHEDAIKKTKETIVNDCNDKIEQVQEVNYDYQKKNHALNKYIDNTKRMYEGGVIRLHTNPTTASVDGAATGGINGRSHVVTHQSLIEFAGACEQLRLRLSSVKDWSDKAYAK